MKSLIHWYFKALEAVMVLCLAAMCVMVFGNVVLRHVFDSGINTSEELARFMFIWLTFLGAIVAMREGGHLGMDMVVSRLTGRTRRAALLLGHVLVLVCCGVLLWGLLLQHDINVANIGLVTGMSLSIVYSVAYLCAVSIGAMVLVNIVTLLRGHDLADPTPAAND
ncbi:tripartite ATP-independent periplasmic transporter, DctQ component family protein [Hydrogenophaga sp. RAC07]|uniref:TRAP transporter small permease n=1 Tax=Hydrogenophaga sp. RAC07 TaxID=1842537 RepID=UPI00083CD7FA|nr:TRAP transporter small permease [Hydrogenophaga sp. RAC07]AOF88204.1 tripartite ATP-independent periplasmic transporter, DctQ component family protein [Hydrogenophaga sp. RAC07]